MREAGDPADPVGPAWLQQVATDITSLGGFTVLTLLVAMVSGFLLLHRRGTAAMLLLATSISAALASTGLKLLVDRPRPDVALHLVGVTSPSFPSGHALLSATIYLTLGALLAREFPAPVLRRYFLGVAGLITALVGLSRIYLGVHWPSDVLAGWCAGALWAWGCWRLDDRLRR